MSVPTSTEKFVGSAFGAGFEGEISLWRRQTNQTSFFPSSSIQALMTVIRNESSRFDLYLAIGTQAEALAKGKRGGADTVRSVAGLVADIDFASRKASKKQYPRDETEALEILRTFELPPTAIVETGNGLHVHFGLAEPYVIRSEQDRRRAKKAFSGFQRTLQRHFKKHGREIDSIGDLSRNFRIPGTLNHKSIPPKAVVLQAFDPSIRYALEEIEQVANATDHRGSTTRDRKTLFPPADHKSVVAECAFYQTLVLDPANVDEPSWFAGASITGRCKDGEAIFHEYSGRHPNYSYDEAQKKLVHALEAGPRSCQSVEDDLGYSGCLACPHRGQITSPIQLGNPGKGYEPGKEGPQPLGFTKEGNYAFRDPVRNIILIASANQLLSQQWLMGAAPSKFWRRQFASKNSLFDYGRAGETLMALCKRKGPFNPAHARGRGIWKEGPRVIINLGSPVPEDVRYTYLCFEPIPLSEGTSFTTYRLLELLKKFTWRHPNDAMLLLGWLAIAPICGVLQWRPHVYLYGPPRCGKTTIHTVIARLLHPLGISTDGQSSEADIRQTLGPDSLPILIDEFESDHAQSQLKGVIRLARSASSAENPVLRGSPEGKAMQFSLRTTFFFGGVNPIGMSPADESRIVLMELMMHANDKCISEQIIVEEAYFKDLGPQWCSYMVSHAGIVQESLDILEKIMSTVDRRHRQNMATLLAGAFIALHGRAPNPDEAANLVAEFQTTVELHAEALERDDAREALDYFFSHPVEGYPLGHWAALYHELSSSQGRETRFMDAKRLVQTYDIAFDQDGLSPCFFLRNGSPNIDKIFLHTKWAERAWMRAIKKLPDAFSPKHPVYFGSTGSKSRATGLPVSYLPDSMEMAADEEKF